VRRGNTLAVAKDDDARILDLAVKRGLIDNVSAREAVFHYRAAKTSGQNVSLVKHLIDNGLITQFQADELLAPAPQAPPAAPAAPAKPKLDPARPLERGDIIGGYRIMDKIGEGAMGAVYRAVQVALDRRVALKLLPQRLAGNKQYLERFLREAKVVARLEHPNIVRAIDAGEADGIYYFAMEIVEGRSLETILEDVSALAEEQAIDLALQATRGLAYAHKSNLIHRDIKPENILVTHDGVIKIADLGLARSVEDEQDMKLTQQGMALGTPHYVSPEQAQAMEVDIRTDIYALGITLYRAVAGVLPFDDNDPVKVIAMRLVSDPLPVRQINENVSRELEQVIMSMTAKDREDRYPNPMVLLHDLERVAAGARPEFAGASRSQRMKIVEAARNSKDTRVMPSAVFRIPRQRGSVVMSLVGGVLLGGVLGALGGIFLAPGGTSPEPAAGRRDALVTSALVEALREHHSLAARLLEQAQSPETGDDLRALTLLIEKSELVYKARQAELKGKSNEAFDIYQKALKIDESPLVRGYLERLENRSR
jgi:serine/threonine-protein kinase